VITTVLTALTILLVIVAAYTDIQWGRILNALTMPGILLGLILNSVRAGSEGLLLSLGGIALGLCLFLVSAVFGRIVGGGDVKLLMAVGALQGPSILVWALFYAAIIGGILAILIAVRHGILMDKIKALFASCYLRLACKVPMDIQEGPAGGPRLPYAIAISSGTLVAMLMSHVS